MAECKHPHLSFEDGTLYIRCIDCDRYWAAVQQKGGQIDHTAMTQLLPIDNTRHSKWTLPRDKKEVTPKKKKCASCGQETTQSPVTKAEASSWGLRVGATYCGECLK